MIYLIFIIIIFLIVLNTLCKYAPVLAATKNEKSYINFKIKYPNVFVISYLFDVLIFNNNVWVRYAGTWSTQICLYNG